jgi:DNA-directed RNA polymerase specialized sigma24 family protein
MEIVRDVETFVEKNGEQLQRFFIYKTGITDRELIHEHLQEFYVKMIQTHALETYDEEKGSFDTYISTLLCWLLSYKKRKNLSIKYKFISSVSTDSQSVSEESDIWDHVSISEGNFKVDFSPCTPRIFDNTDEYMFNHYLNEFKGYIHKTELPRNRDRMLTFLECKENGCNSSEIAVVLGVSDNMVKIIKQKLREKLERWKTLS